MVKVLSIVFVLCVLSAPAVVMAKPTFEILSEAQSTGIPMDAIDVKLPSARCLGNLAGSLEMVARVFDDAALRPGRGDGSDVGAGLPYALDMERAGALHDVHLFGPAWTEAAMLTTWNAADDEPTLKVSWTEAPPQRNQNARPPTDRNADLRYR